MAERGGGDRGGFGRGFGGRGRGGDRGRGRRRAGRRDEEEKWVPGRVVAAARFLLRPRRSLGLRLAASRTRLVFTTPSLRFRRLYESPSPRKVGTMDAMEAKMNEWRRRMPSKRALTSQLGQFVQQKSVAVLYTQSEQERIKNVTELIQRATNEFEKEEPWDRIMKVVDVVSNTANKHVLKEAIRYVRLRLGDPSPRVVLLTLSLTEALMKNCNRYVHKEIGSEAFMSEMESLYKVHSCKRGRDSMEIEGRVLELIQTWGESFMNQKFEFPYFIYTYEKLRKKGVRFPKFDKTKAPIFNAGVGSSSYSSGPVASRMRSSSSSSNSSRSGASGSLAKLSSKEVYHVATNVSEMFEDMIHEVERDGVTPSFLNSGVIVELAVQAQELLVRLQAVIQSAADNESDEDLGRYLAVNDSLHTAITRYEDLKSGKANNNQNGHASKKAPSSSNQFDNDDDDDDGFGDFVRARVGGDSKPAAAATSNQVDNDDEDPFASFVQQRTTKTVEETKAPAPATNLIDLWDDAPAQPTVTQPLAPADPATPLVADLWGASNDLLAPAAPAAVVAAPAPAPAPVAKPQTSAFDDIWGDLATPSPAPVIAPLQPAQPAFVPAPSVAPTMNGNAAAANPFDFFDDFSTKATISAPVTQPAAAPVAKANPFDFGFPPPPAQTQAALPQSKPSATLNPFDF